MTIPIYLLTTAAFAAPTAETLLNATDDVLRGESSTAVVEMTVKTAHYERTMKMRSWALGTEKSLIVIEEPAKERGVSTLKVGQNIWNYLPKVDRTMKVPAGMMSGSWMGSHFSNDDLVKESRLSDDFTWTEPTQDATGLWHLILTPREDAALPWGRLDVVVSNEYLPISIAYMDEHGKLARTLTWEDPRDVDGRVIPTTMRLVPANKPTEFTLVKYIDIDFDADIPESQFSLQALKR